MRHRSIKSRAGKVMLGAVLAGALSGAGASIARATLTLDLEAGSGTPVSPVTTASVSPGTPVTLTVYAVVTDPADSGPAGDGLGGLFASFDATGSGISSSNSGLSASLSPPGTFNYNPGIAASNGVGYTYTDSSGNVHNGVGNYSGASTGGPTTPTYDSTTPSNWVFAAYLLNNGTTVGSIYNGGTALANNAGAYFDLGTLTLNTSATAANGSTVTVNGYGRTQQTGQTMVAALWTENGVVKTPTAGQAIGADDSVTVTVGSTVVNHLTGDTYPYDNFVNVADLDNVLNNLGTTNQVGFAWPNTSSNEGVVGVSDLDNVLNNLGTGNGNPPSIVLAPEPAAMSLLALGLIGLVRKRSK